MSRKLAICSLATLAGAAMLALTMGPASVFTLVSPSPEQPVASAQIEKVWWRRWGWGGGWGPGYGYGWRHCWINRWGYRVCNW
jgi:hypothetical protein